VARLTKSIKDAMGYEDVPTFFWSDSTTALAWIRRNDEWGTFVWNRVKEICKLTHHSQWRHVPGVLNPADLPSRGCTPSELLKSKWWEGPSWLKSNRQDWPSMEPDGNEDDIVSERKKSATSTMIVSEGPSPWYYRRFSSHLKNVRVIAWILRFLHKIRKMTSDKGELTQKEVAIAERTLFGLVQKEALASVVTKDVVEGVRVVREDGIIYVKTKLLHRQDSSSFIKPVLLPNNHPVVEQLIRQEHLCHHHAGVQFLMGKLREKVWILQGRKAIKRILRGCVKCRLHSAKAPEVPEAPLPEDRVKKIAAEKFAMEKLIDRSGEAVPEFQTKFGRSIRKPDRFGFGQK
jgi:hypothetical protein